MNALFHSATLISAAAVSNLISAIWQGAVLAVAVALCLRLMPRLSAAWRSLIWMTVFLLLVLLHVLPVLRAQAVVGSGLAHAARIDLDLRWSLAIGAVWVALSLWRAGQLAESAVRLHALAARAKPMEPGDDLAPLLIVGSRGRAAELCTSTEVERPSVFGFSRPRILLPPDLAGHLSPLELRQVVLHEMEHLRRADDWTNLLQKVALVLFPLNPVLLWVERRLCAERELACDDRVLLSSGAHKAYAVCLTRLAEYRLLRRGVSLALGAWERRPELVRRVHRLLRGPERSMSRVRAALATASVVALTLGGASELERSPQLVGFSEPHAASATAQQTTWPHAPTVAAHMQPVTLRGDVFPPAQIVEARAVMPSSSTAAPAPRKVCARLRSAKIAKPKRTAPPQEWVMLTEWTETVAPVDSADLVLRSQSGQTESSNQTGQAGQSGPAIQPPQPVLTVFRINGGSYAAVRTWNGWLIVQI